MRNYEGLLNEIIERIFTGDVDKLRKYFEFMNMFLGRYENLYICAYDDDSIYLKDSVDEYINGKVTVEPDSIKIEIKFLMLDYNGKAFNTGNDLLILQEDKLCGEICSFVPNRSNIFFSGNKNIKNGEPHCSKGYKLRIFFNRVGILDSERKTIILPFDSDDNSVMFNKLRAYEAKAYRQIFNNFFIGNPYEFNVRSVNYKELSEEEIKKYEDEISNMPIEPSDIVECYHQEILDDVNPEEIELKYGEISFNKRFGGKK